MYAVKRVMAGAWGSCLLPAGLLLAGCAPHSLPNNSRCLTWRQAGLSRIRAGDARTFLALGTADSARRPPLDYTRFCVQYIISERRNLGLFRISQPGQPAWKPRYFLNTPRRLFLLYPQPSRLVRTYTVEQALAARDCQLSESARQDVLDYLKLYPY